MTMDKKELMYIEDLHRLTGADKKLCEDALIKTKYNIEKARLILQPSKDRIIAVSSKDYTPVAHSGSLTKTASHSSGHNESGEHSAIPFTNKAKMIAKHHRVPSHHKKHMAAHVVDSAKPVEAEPSQN